MEKIEEVYKQLGVAEAHLWLLLQDPKGYRDTAINFLKESDVAWCFEEENNG